MDKKISPSLMCADFLHLGDELKALEKYGIEYLHVDIMDGVFVSNYTLGVIAEMADYVVVMYAGRVVEKGTVHEIFKQPAHPYTIGLHKSKPAVSGKVDRLFSIPGQVPNPINMPTSCYFRDRCDRCTAACSGEYPGMIQLSPTHFVACHLYDGKDNNQTKKEENK